VFPGARYFVSPIYSKKIYQSTALQTNHLPVSREAALNNNDNHDNERRRSMLSSLSKLTPQQLEEIRSLEQKLGKTLLSFSSYDVVSDELSGEELALLKGLEEKLGTMLVAVRGLSQKP
jgi:hypothetical protein